MTAQDTEFDKPDRRARLAQLGFLVKHSFTIIGRNRGLIRPVIVMTLYAVVMIVMAFAGLFLIIMGQGHGTWLLIVSLLMFIWKFFFYSRMGLILGHMTHAGATGGPVDYRAARKSLAGLGWQIRILGMLGLFGAWVALRKNSSGGIMRLILGGLVEIWDLVNHFLLPAIAIDRLRIRDATARLRTLRNHVPETLAGVFGIDIMAGVVGSLMAPVYFFGILFGILGGVWLGGDLPAAFSAGKLGELIPQMPDIAGIGPETVFSWLPLFLLIFLGMVLNTILGRIVFGLKVIYFTLFYTRITHPETLSPDLRAEVEGYLELDEAGIARVAPQGAS